MPDVVLVDLNLGERSGFELLADLNRRAMRVKTLVTTMSSRPSDVAEALRLGADGYVLKGSSGNELLEAIDAVLSGKRYFEGRVTELAVQGLTTPTDASALSALSARERQVVLLVVNGRTSAEIAEELHLSPKTVDSYLQPSHGQGGRQGRAGPGALRAARRPDHRRRAVAHGVIDEHTCAGRAGRPIAGAGTRGAASCWPKTTPSVAPSRWSCCAWPACPSRRSATVPRPWPQSGAARSTWC